MKYTFLVKILLFLKLSLFSRHCLASHDQDYANLLDGTFVHWTELIESTRLEEVLSFQDLDHVTSLLSEFDSEYGFNLLIDFVDSDKQASDYCKFLYFIESESIKKFSQNKLNTILKEEISTIEKREKMLKHAYVLTISIGAYFSKRAEHVNRYALFLADKIGEETFSSSKSLRYEIENPYIRFSKSYAFSRILWDISNEFPQQKSYSAAEGEMWKFTKVNKMKPLGSDNLKSVFKKNWDKRRNAKFCYYYSEQSYLLNFLNSNKRLLEDSYAAAFENININRSLTGIFDSTENWLNFKGTNFRDLLNRSSEMEHTTNTLLLELERVVGAIDEIDHVCEEKQIF